MARLIRPPEHVLIVSGNLRMESHKGRVDGFCRRLLELRFSEDAYQVIETNEMPDLTSELVAQSLVSDSRLHAVYMANQPPSGRTRHPKARRAVRPHIIWATTHTCREAVSAGRHGGFCRRSNLLAGVVSGGSGNVSNAAARCEAEA